MSIELVPDLKKLPHIYGAHKNEKLVIFVGAGMSALWGCKRWKDMAIALIDSCYERGNIDYWARETLLTKYSGSPRKLITIAKSILNDNYLEELKKTLQLAHEQKAKVPDLFNNLFSLQAAYITTNIDDHFSSLFDKGSVYIEPSKFSLAVLKPKNVIHLHGVIHNPSSLAMTVDEYIDRYQDKNFRGFLEEAFFDDKYCFLFIGYGVDEMEIIDFMIQRYSKGVKSLRGFLHRFYILLPFFHNEEPLFKYEQLYFDQINMTVIPYSINAKGYYQIDEVLSSWRKAFEEYGKGDEFYGFNEIIEKNL